MKILLTANTAWNLVNFRRALIEGLIEDGHEIIALCPLDGTALNLEAMGCRVVHLEMDNKGLSMMRDLFLILRFWRHFRRERPDLILSYTIKNNIYCALATRPLGIPVIPNVTGLGTAFLSGGWVARVAICLSRIAFQSLRRIAFQNEDDRDHFLTHMIVRPEQVMMLPGSGIDVERFQPCPLSKSDGPLVFLFIGRLLRDKGVQELIEAVRLLQSRGVNICCQLLGSADAENRTAIDSKTLGEWISEGVVEYLGTTDDVRPMIAAADCIVLPSYREGTPRALLEGSAMARPCVATDVPGCRHVVEDGVTGFLCLAQNPQDLADKMADMAALSSEERQRMGLAGRAKMEREYDQAFVLDTYRTAIATIMKR